MGHLIVKEHRGFTNHFVPENRRVSYWFRHHLGFFLTFASSSIISASLRTCRRRN
jgi:hypothetical protein